MAADIGLIGLAVMGRNLALNMAHNGFEVAVYNRTTSRMTEFVEGDASGASVAGHCERRGGPRGGVGGCVFAWPVAWCWVLASGGCGGGHGA